MLLTRRLNPPPFFESKDFFLLPTTTEFLKKITLPVSDLTSMHIFLSHSALGERVNVTDEKSILKCGFRSLQSTVGFFPARWVGTNANISPILEINLCAFSLSRISSFQCSAVCLRDSSDLLKNVLNIVSIPSAMKANN